MEVIVFAPRHLIENDTRWRTTVACLTDYHDGAGYYMNALTYAYFKKAFKDDNNRPLFLQGDNYGHGGVGTFDGTPIYINNQFPSIAAGQKGVVVFGNLKLGFTIRMIDQVKVVSSRELYWKSQALALAGWAAMDCNVTDAYALSTLTMKAS